MSAPSTTQLSVDVPAPGHEPIVRGELVIEGWAWSSDGPVAVTVTLAGRAVPVQPGALRPDVSEALGTGELRGFLSVAALDDLPAGAAELVTTATGPDAIPVRTVRTVHVAGGRAGVVDGDGERPRPWGGVEERLDPQQAPGGITHTEHVARYRWAAQLAAGRDVLDAGCGVGYGARILHEAGARRVVGVDAFAAAILEAREQSTGEAEFLLGDLRELRAPDDSFDLVVCFEAIEHVAEQGRVLDELARVLRPGGVLVISTPIPGVSTVHNPHHVHELTPDELEEELRARFAHVRTHVQYTAVASVIDAGPPHGTPPPLPWMTGPAEPPYALALAGDGVLPDVPPAGALAAGVDVALLVSHYVLLNDHVSALQADAAVQRARADRLGALCQTLEQQLARATGDTAVIAGSRSWRVTRPFRDIARHARERR